MIQLIWGLSKEAFQKLTWLEKGYWNYQAVELPNGKPI